MSYVIKKETEILTDNSKVYNVIISDDKNLLNLAAYTEADADKFIDKFKQLVDSYICDTIIEID